jgi:hypothetical protein
MTKPNRLGGLLQFSNVRNFLYLIDYPQRMINYALGIAEDINIAAFNPTSEIIQNWHMEAIRLAAGREKKLEPQRPAFRIR